MTDLEYKELNEYLKKAVMYLEYDCMPFLDNIDFICMLNDACYNLLKEYKLVQKTKENKLTYEDVYKIARKIIKKINPEYIKKYDRIIETGMLDFGYEDEYDTSNYEHSKDKMLININRKFNYSDVLALIHEFIHYINIGERCNKLTHLLTEFFSIYFEQYALEYLIDNGVSEEEINYIGRFENTYKLAADFNCTLTPIFSYVKFGSVDKKSYELLQKFFMPNITLKAYEGESSILLDFFKRKEKKYFESHSKEDYDEYDLGMYYGEYFSSIFRYLIGTALTFYANKNCEIKDIVYMLDHINSEEYDDILKCLKRMKIDINDKDFIDIIINNMEDYLEDFSVEKKEDNEEKVY